MRPSGAKGHFLDGLNDVTGSTACQSAIEFIGTVVALTKQCALRARKIIYSMVLLKILAHHRPVGWPIGENMGTAANLPRKCALRAR
jgi:hypothetical protein